MKFENKGKWAKQISESAQKNEGELKYFTYTQDKLKTKADCDKALADMKKAFAEEPNFDAKKVIQRDMEIVKSWKSQKNEGLDKKHIDYLNGRLEHVYDLDGVAREMLGPVRDYMVKYNIKVADYLPYMPDDTKRRITYACRRQNRVPSNKYMKDDIFAGWWHGGKEKALLESNQKNESTESVQVMLDKSLSEENKAVADYLERAAKCKEIGDTKVAELFEELARDESVHVAQLEETKEIFGLNDAEVEQEGSKEAQEILQTNEANHSKDFNKNIYTMLEKVSKSILKVTDSDYRKAQQILGYAAICLGALQNYVNHVGQNTDEWLADHPTEAEKYFKQATDAANKL